MLMFDMSRTKLGRRELFMIYFEGIEWARLILVTTAIVFQLAAGIFFNASKSSTRHEARMSFMAGVICEYATVLFSVWALVYFNIINS